MIMSKIISNYISKTCIIKRKSTEYDSYAGFENSLSKTHSVFCQIVNFIGDIYTRVPIHAQILDMAHQRLHEKLLKMEIDDKLVLQIRVDSILFIDNNNIIDQHIDDLQIGGWRKSTYVPYTKILEPTIKKMNTLWQKNKVYPDISRTLEKCYAGAGKTYRIKNNIIPLYEDQNYQYRILTPSHSSLMTYRQCCPNNCNVIHSFSLTKKIPEEPNLIIDEIGMCDRMATDFLYKCMLLGKSIYSCGDFNQMPPVGEDKPFCSPQWLDYMYNNQISSNKNWRNDFPRAYYDELMIKNNAECIEIAKLYSEKNYYDAKIIICYRNKTQQKYNNLMLKHLGYITEIEYSSTKNHKIGLMPRKKGIKYICIITNEILMRSNIYNGKQLLFDHETEDDDGNKFIVFDNGDTVKEAHFIKHFKPAYAIKIYGAQSNEYASIYWCGEDNYWLNGTYLYTLISRLSGHPFAEKNPLECAKYDILRMNEWRQKITNDLKYKWNSFNTMCNHKLPQLLECEKTCVQQVSFDENQELMHDMLN